MTIDLGKFYKTRKGLKVRLYANDGGPGQRLHGAYLTTDPSTNNAGWRGCTWNMEGQFNSVPGDLRDIVSEWYDDPPAPWRTLTSTNFISTKTVLVLTADRHVYICEGGNIEISIGVYYININDTQHIVTHWAPVPPIE
jgi:hypothetical protein